MTVRAVARSAFMYAVGVMARPRGAAVRILNGHSLEPVDARSFRELLHRLRQRFEFVSLADACRLLRQTEPLDGRYLAFSFDDGYRDNHDVIAPILVDFGATACFFLSVNLIESDSAYQDEFFTHRVRSIRREPMTWRMVDALARGGFLVGAHTMDHLNLAQIPANVALAQVLDSKHAIAERVGVPCEFFAWPYGRLDAFPPTLVPRVKAHFREIFSSLRSDSCFSYGSAVINRDHFEPDWPVAHVNYVLSRRVSRRPAGPELPT